MDLKEFTSPLPKPWLTINCANLKADSSQIDDIQTNILTLNNEVSVPNAPVNATSFFSSGIGNMSQTDQFGATVHYATTSLITNAVMSDGLGSVTGNIPDFKDTSGLLVGDSGIAMNNLFLADGSVHMTGPLNVDSQHITLVTALESFQAGQSVVWGSGSSIVGSDNNLRNVILGYNNDNTGFACQCIGNENHQTIGAGECNLIGSSNSVAGSQSSAYGDGNTITGDFSLVLGSNNTLTGSNSGIIGQSGTNSVSNSLMINNYNSLYSGTTCDLGTVSNPFQNLYIGQVISPQASASSISQNILNTPQVAANLLVNLSPSSSVIIPAFSANVGDVYELIASGSYNCTAGQTFQFDIGRGGGGSYITLSGAPIVSGTHTFYIKCFFTFTSSTSINISGFLQDYDVNGVLVGGVVGAVGQPLDNSVNQSITFTYTTANLTVMAVEQVILKRMLP